MKSSQTIQILNKCFVILVVKTPWHTTHYRYVVFFSSLTEKEQASNEWEENTNLLKPWLIQSCLIIRRNINLSGVSTLLLPRWVQAVHVCVWLPVWHVNPSNTCHWLSLGGIIRRQHSSGRVWKLGDMKLKSRLLPRRQELHLYLQVQVKWGNNLSLKPSRCHPHPEAKVSVNYTTKQNWDYFFLTDGYLTCSYGIWAVSPLHKGQTSVSSIHLLLVCR